MDINIFFLFIPTVYASETSGGVIYYAADGKDITYNKFINGSAGIESIRIAEVKQSIKREIAYV